MVKIGTRFDLEAGAGAVVPMSTPKITKTFNRRLFAQRAASAAALILLPPTDLAAEQKLDSELDQKPDDLSAADWEEVRARHQNLLRMYGDRLSADEKRRSLHVLITNQRMLTSIRSFAVQNNDPSACTLRVVL